MNQNNNLNRVIFSIVEKFRFELINATADLDIKK
jgi:hypothetical protein